MRAGESERGQSDRPVAATLGDVVWPLLGLTLVVVMGTAFACLLALSLPILAPPTPAERLAKGKALLAELEYEDAATELMLLANDASAPQDVRLQAHLLAGTAFVVLDRPTEARLAFQYVLRREPDTTLPPDTAFKIVSFFELCRDEVESMNRLAARPAEPAHAAAPPPTPPAAEPGDEAATTAAPPWLPYAVAGSGAALLAAGVALALVGGQPWLQHEAAADQLRTLEGAGETDGAAELQQEQRSAGEAWTSWGLPLAVGGWSAVAVGGLLAGVGLGWGALAE